MDAHDGIVFPHLDASTDDSDVEYYKIEQEEDEFGDDQ